MQNDECKMQNESCFAGNPAVDKSFDFAVRIVNVYKYLTRKHREYVLSKQLLRCGTSIGANIMEAQRGQSHADFSAKMNIALKEANEAYYWVKLLYRTDYLTDAQYASLNSDVLELIGILTAICKTSQNRTV